MPENIIKFIKYNEKYEEFVICCRNKSTYQKFIGDSVSTENLYIIYCGKEEGLLEVYNINDEDSNLSINIFLLDDFKAMSGMALFKAIDFVFDQYKVHKIIIKVFDFNEKMISILNKLKIFFEGRIIIDCNENRYVNIYSILKSEYDSIKSLRWRELVFKR